MRNKSINVSKEVSRQTEARQPFGGYQESVVF